MDKIINHFPLESLSILNENKLLRPLIKSELTKYVTKSIHIDDETIEKYLDVFKSNNQISEDESFKKWLIQNKTTEEILTKDIIISLKVEKLSEDKFSHKIESRFLEKKHLLDSVVYSLIRVKDFNLARELRFRIEAEEASFHNVATNWSCGLEKNTGGIIGPVPLFSGHPIIIETLRTSDVGQLHGPLKVDEWNVLIRLESYENAKLDDKMRIELKKEMFEEWISEQTESKLNAIIKDNSLASG